MPATWKQSHHAFRVPAKRYRIGELVRCSPFSRQTIHNYTIMGLIREAEWTEGGHRLYDESVFGRLSRILELRMTYSLAETRRILTEEEKMTLTDDRDDVPGSIEGTNGLGRTSGGQPRQGEDMCQDQPDQNV